MSSKSSTIEKVDDRLARVYADEGDKRAVYDEWAENYEHDLVADLDYVAHVDAVNIFAEEIADRNSRVIDVACGSGLAGQELADSGYRQIDGVDFSEKMLQLASRRGLYRSLFQHDFMQPFVPETPYQALICVGMFSFTQPPVTVLHHVVDCVEPGGICVVTVNGAAWRELDLEPRVYDEAGLHGFSIRSIRTARYIQKENIDARVLTIVRH